MKKKSSEENLFHGLQLNKFVIFLVFLFIRGTVSFGQEAPTLRLEDKIRIREAIRISDQFGEEIWEGFGKVPFVVLLVTDSTEFLIHHPYPSDDFKLSENDPILGTRIVYRPRKYSANLLATFPAVNGVACVVIGTPENTGKTSSDWVITMLHEHFHQYQYTQPDYYSGVDQLDLTGGDQTGMWQLNYPFPYEDPKVNKQFLRYKNALIYAVSGMDGKDYPKDFEKFKAEREQFKKILDPAPYRYFSFQLWQEGLARYTEYKFLEKLSAYSPSTEMEELSDYADFRSLKDEFMLREMSVLKNSILSVNKRVSFYSLGFAEGLLLDRQNPNWRELYLEKKFNPESYFTELK